MQSSGDTLIIVRNSVLQSVGLANLLVGVQAGALPLQAVVTGGLPVSAGHRVVGGVGDVGGVAIDGVLEVELPLSGSQTETGDPRCPLCSLSLLQWTTTGRSYCLGFVLFLTDFLQVPVTALRSLINCSFTFLLLIPLRTFEQTQQLACKRQLGFFPRLDLNGGGVTDTQI